MEYQKRRWNNDENGGIIKIGTTVSNEIYNNKKFARLPKMQANIKEMLRYRLNNCH